MVQRDAKQLAELLASFYKSSFYGKKNTKYRIKRQDLKALAGGKGLPKFIEVKSALRDKGYHIVKLINEYAVIEIAPLFRCRSVKKAMIEEFTSERASAKKGSPEATKKTTKKSALKKGAKGN